MSIFGSVKAHVAKQTGTAIYIWYWDTSLRLAYQIY